MSLWCSKQWQDSRILYRRWCDGWYQCFGPSRWIGRAWIEKATEETKTSLQMLGKELQKERVGFKEESNLKVVPDMFDSGEGNNQIEHRSSGGVRAVSTHRPRQISPALCSDASLLQSSWQEKDIWSAFHFTSADIVRPICSMTEINIPLWLGKQVFDCRVMLQECRVGCYEQSACICFLSDIISQGKAEESGLGETYDAEHSRHIFTPDQGCCHVVLTADPQESVPDAQGYKGVALPLPLSRSVPLQ